MCVQVLAVVCVSSTGTRQSTSSHSTPQHGEQKLLYQHTINVSIYLSIYLLICSAERKAAVAEGKARVNKLVSAYSSQHSEGPELTQAVQELCQQASAFVLVVDTSKVEGEGQCLVVMGDHLLVSSPD